LRTNGNKPIPTNITMKKNKVNMTAKEEKESEDDANAVVLEQGTESQGSEPRRSAGESQPVSRLEPNTSGKSYVQNNKKTKKKVVFAEDELKQLEYFVTFWCHN
jgi:hypothetical protein